MRGRPGYLRLCLAVFRQMTRWSTDRWVFPWILLGAPLAAWVLPGGTRIPFLPFAISAVTWCFPAAFIAGWPGSGDRKALEVIMYGTGAGKYSLTVPEILLPLLAGVVPGCLLALVWSSGGRGVSWQLWTVIPFSSLTAVSATVLLGRFPGGTGHLVNLLGFMAQASTAPWAGNGLFQLLVPQGYTLWTIRWMTGSGAAFHGDIYAFFAVLSGIGLALLAFRTLGNPGKARVNPAG